MMKRLLIFALVAVLVAFVSGFSQTPNDTQRKNQSQIRVVSLPISIFTEKELKKKTGAEEFIELPDLWVKENGEQMKILSLRNTASSPLTLAIVVQDDLVSGFNLQLEDIKKNIRSLPQGSRVMVAYIRAGSAQIRQKFTDNLEKAANSLRVVTSSASLAPRNPYDGLNDILGKFDAQPFSRRAVILFSDGFDGSSGGFGLSNNLDAAVSKSLKKSVAVYSISYPTTQGNLGTSMARLAGHSGLEKLSTETGGRAFISGTSEPVSINPFLKDLSFVLTRQFLITYLSPNMKKRFYQSKSEQATLQLLSNIQKRTITGAK